MTATTMDEREWIETDGRGGFASGTVSGIRTRRYHGLLLVATTPPTGRMMLVNGLEVWAVRDGRREALSAQRYDGDVVYPDGGGRLVSFARDPWPTWTYRLDAGGTVTQEIFVRRRTGAVVVSWTTDAEAAGVEFEVRPLVSGRDYHALHHENASVDLRPTTGSESLAFVFYPGVPPVVVGTTGVYEHRPDWYRRFLYVAERDRGLDCVEDLATPGVFRLTSAHGPACLVFATDETALEGGGPSLGRRVGAWKAEESSRRSQLGSPLDRAADAYFVQRGRGRTLVAGYPWFTDWGRDTFIALRGLGIAAGRIEEAREILLEWSDAVSEGMLPNRFPDRGDAPEFNSVDASLWFVLTAGEFGRAARKRGGLLGDADEARLDRATEAILTAYATGTRYGIRADGDGLLMAGAPGVQLTWMDAKVGDWVVTPRVGKPVEVQALWLNALAEGARRHPRWKLLLDRGLASFRARFWNASRGCLYDVVDADHVQGRVDAAVRPNQIFAIGGLPLTVLNGELSRRALETVERLLLTPMGLRTLAPDEPGYVATYQGDVRARDGAYHQGTVWPWLLGPFVEAWLRAHGDTPERRAEARARFLAPLVTHLEDAGLGHVSEIADAEPPHTPRGCPFQAWSVGELLRLDRVVLATPLESAPESERAAVARIAPGVSVP